MHYTRKCIKHTSALNFCTNWHAMNTMSCSPWCCPCEVAKLSIRRKKLLHIQARDEYCALRPKCRLCIARLFTSDAIKLLEGELEKRSTHSTLYMSYVDNHFRLHEIDPHLCL